MDVNLSLLCSPGFGFWLQPWLDWGNGGVTVIYKKYHAFCETCSAGLHMLLTMFCSGSSSS